MDAPTDKPTKSIQVVPRMLVCLVMMVKDNERTIEQCLRSVAPFVDTYCISDIGSTDNTKSVIKSVMSSLRIEGIIRDHKWVSCGHNRTLSLIAARRHCPKGWSWVVDTNEIISLSHPAPPVDLIRDIPENHTSASITIGGSGVVCRVFNNAYEWYYKGAIDETPCLDVETLTPAILGDLALETVESVDVPFHIDTARREILADVSLTFQHAYQQKQDGATDTAKKYYQICVNTEDPSGKFANERYASCIELINLTPVVEEKTKYVRKALEIDATRLDALYYLLAYAVALGTPAAFTAEMVEIGMSLKNRDLLPHHVLAEGSVAVWQEIYTWRFSDAYSIALYWRGFYKESVEESNRALAKCPDTQRPRLTGNMTFAIGKLAQ